MFFHSPVTVESIPLFNRRTNEATASCSTYMHLRFIGPPRQNIAYMTQSSTKHSIFVPSRKFPTDYWSYPL